MSSMCLSIHIQAHGELWSSSHVTVSHHLLCSELYYHFDFLFSPEQEVSASI